MGLDIGYIAGVKSRDLNWPNERCWGNGPDGRWSWKMRIHWFMGDSTSPRTVVVCIHIHFLYDLNPYSMYGETQKYQKESVGFLFKLQVLLQMDESFAESTLKLSSRISHSTYHPMASSDRHNLSLMAQLPNFLPKMSFLASTSTTI